MGDANDEMLIAIAHVAVGVASPPPPSSCDGADGEGMEDAIRDVTKEAKWLQAFAEGQQVWIGVAGPPGGGKTSLCTEVARRLNADGVATAVVPMDGFHFSKAHLDLMPNPQEAHDRRGAEWTFDAEGLVRRLREVRAAGEGKLPGFDHAVGDPVEDQVVVRKEDKVVLVEGNYLLLWDKQPWGQIAVILDRAWFVACPLSDVRSRVIARNSAAWGWDYERTAQRVDSNDVPNAVLVEKSMVFADAVIPSRSDPRLGAGKSEEDTDASPVAAVEVTKIDGMAQALIIETGFGATQDSLDASKAAVRACRNAIEFNSAPVLRCAPGGIDNVLLRVTIGVPKGFEDQVSVDSVRQAFPKGLVHSVTVQEGGALFTSGLRRIQAPADQAEDGSGGTAQARAAPRGAVGDVMLVSVAHVVIGLREPGAWDL